MKTFKKVLIILLAVLPAIISAVAVFFFLPDTVSAHFGPDGTVDRYGSKYEAFILPAVILLLCGAYLLFRGRILKPSSADPERSARRGDVTDTVVMLLLVLMNALNIMLLLLMDHAESIRQPAPLAAMILSTVVGIVLILLGNIMPKTKRNSVIGMRMRFTMDTDEHWYLANRAGGIALVISGLVTVAAGFITRSIAYIFWMAGALVVTLTVASLYSYAIIKREKS